MKLAALGVAAAIIATTGGLFFAQVCAVTQHDCHKTAVISTCCGDAQDAARIEATPVQSRVEIRADLSATHELPNSGQMAPAAQALIPVQTSPPRLCLLDLPTLFSAFLL